MVRFYRIVFSNFFGLVAVWLQTVSFEQMSHMGLFYSTGISNITKRESYFVLLQSIDPSFLYKPTCVRRQRLFVCTFPKWMHLCTPTRTPQTKSPLVIFLSISAPTASCMAISTHCSARFCWTWITCQIIYASSWRLVFRVWKLTMCCVLNFISLPINVILWASKSHRVFIL